MEYPAKELEIFGKPRRKNRAAVLQFLYMWDVHLSDDFSTDLKEFLECQSDQGYCYAFAEELAHGTITNIQTIDGLIQKFAVNWEFKRIAKVDLAILRLAIYELLYRKDIPPIVSINEAIDLTKTFSSPDSKRFVNGMLDQVKKVLDRPLRHGVENTQ